MPARTTACKVTSGCFCLGGWWLQRINSVHYNQRDQSQSLQQQDSLGGALLARGVLVESLVCVELWVAGAPQVGWMIPTGMLCTACCHVNCCCNWTPRLCSSRIQARPPECACMRGLQRHVKARWRNHRSNRSIQLRNEMSITSCRASDIS